jgi:hypothetical protein
MRFFVLGVCALASVAQAAGTGNFYTNSSGQIIDPNGNVFVAKGINVSGPNWVHPRDVTQDVDVLTNGWQFNTLRVNTVLMKGWTAANDAYIENLVNTYTSRKVVLMFEAHDKYQGAEQWGDTLGSGGYYKPGAEYAALNAFWGKMATKYKNNPYVWFNVQNEPVSDHDKGTMVPDPTPTNPYNQYPDARLQESDRVQWLGYHQGVINTIRAAGANNMVVVDGLHWGVDTGGIWEDKPLPDGYSAILTYGKEMLQNNNNSGNVLFDLHVYGEWAGANANKLRDFVQRAKAQGLPLIFGEYGNSYDRVSSETVNMFTVANEMGIGRLAWSWFAELPGALTDPSGTPSVYPYTDQNGWTSMITNYGGGWKIDSMINPTNLTPWGQAVWNDTHPMAIPEPAVAGGLMVLAPLLLTRQRR